MCLSKSIVHGGLVPFMPLLIHGMVFAETGQHTRSSGTTSLFSAGFSGTRLHRAHDVSNHTANRNQRVSRSGTAASTDTLPNEAIFLETNRKSHFHRALNESQSTEGNGKRLRRNVSLIEVEHSREDDFDNFGNYFLLSRDLNTALSLGRLASTVVVKGTPNAPEGVPRDIVIGVSLGGVLLLLVCVVIFSERTRFSETDASSSPDYHNQFRRCLGPRRNGEQQEQPPSPLMMLGESLAGKSSAGPPSP